MASYTKHSKNDDENLETFSIYWLDASINNDQNLAAQKELRGIINQLKTFDDTDEFIDRIRQMCEGDLTVLIVSGQLGAPVVPEIHGLPQVSSIYVYCMNKAAHEKWSRSYSKVKAVCTSLDELINRIRMDQKSRAKVEEPLSLNILGRSSTDLNGQFLHSQLLIYVLLKMKPNEKEKPDLIKLCKNEYKKNDDGMALVDEFERQYHSSKAIWWYTRESFVYRMLNKALRIQNVEVLYLFRTVIQDMYVQLCQNQCKESVRVYRGQWMSKVEVNQLQNSIGNLTSMNSFLSTSLNRNVALRFLQNNGSMAESEHFEPVLFEIDADPQVISSKTMMKMTMDWKPFAKISEFSDLGHESEVLFMLGSVFFLNRIYHDSLLLSSSSSSFGVDASRMAIIRMTLSSSDHNNDLKRLYQHMRKQYDDIEETNLLSLADVMLQMGKFDLAEKYYRRLLSEFPSNHPSLSQLYYNLGMVADDRGEYDISLQWYEKSLEIDVRTRPSNHVSIGNTHNSIGEALRKRGELDRALESYNRAVSLFKQAHDDNHPDMAMLYNNIGIIYRQQQKYVEALNFYQKGLAIHRQHLPSDHPYLSGSYNNIGIIHNCLGHCDVALEYYNRSLKISLKSLPAQHPDIAMTYKNMGLVYEYKGELEQALTFLEKASTIYQSSLPKNHPNVIEIKKGVQLVKDKLNQSKVSKTFLSKTKK